MWEGLRRQLGERRWLAAAVGVYLALTGVEAARLSLFERPETGAAGVYGWELAAAVPGTRPTSLQLTESDGGRPGSPPPPPRMTAMATSADRIEVSWEAPTDSVQGYKLQRALLGGGWQTTWMTPNESVQGYSVVPGSTYCFRVRSFNGAGHSLYTYPTPPCVVATESVRFRWTTDFARLVEVPGGKVVTLHLESGRDSAEVRVPVAISVDGEPIESVSLRGAQWQTLSYYLPILVPERSWSDGASRDGGEGAGLGGRGGPAPDASVDPALESSGRLLAELRPWVRRRAAQPVRLDVAVGATFVPAEVAGDGSQGRQSAPLQDDDLRELGIRLAPLQWRDDVPVGGIGFHGWEESADGRRFRWTRAQASQPETPAGAAAVFSLRADHPDIDERPVGVRVYWNERLLEEIVLRDRAWTEARIDVEDATAGVLSLRVDRTWVPADSGMGADTRALGVAMTPVAWR